MFITGGCGDIGLVIAQAFLDEGRKVTLVDLDVAPGKALAAAHEAVTLIGLSLAVPDAVETHLRPLARPRDAPDVLIDGVGRMPKTNSGGWSWTTRQMPVEHFSQVVAVNLTAVFQRASLYISAMLERGHARIMNTASLAARMGGKVAPVHLASGKADDRGLTTVMTRDLVGTGVTVNAINPRRADTKMVGDVPDEVDRAILAKIPVG